MRQLDKFEQIGFDAPVGSCCVIIGNIPTGDFALVDPSLVPLPEETAAEFHARGLGFVATFGVVEGKFVSAFAVPVSDQLAALLFQDYSVFLLKKFTEKSGGDSEVEWIKKLFDFPDNRNTEEN
jgi:hypothetical protein